MLLNGAKHLGGCKLYTWDTPTLSPLNCAQTRPLATLFSQTTKFTCGAAALSTVASIFGVNITEENAANVCGTVPGKGTCNETLKKVASSFLPVKDCGENVYQGGLAIANIRNQISKGGHYVVLLGEKDNQYRYFCPKLGAIVMTHKDDIRWMNSSDNLKNWSLCFDMKHDLYDGTFTTQGLLS